VEWWSKSFPKTFKYIGEGQAKGGGGGGTFGSAVSNAVGGLLRSARQESMSDGVQDEMAEAPPSMARPAAPGSTGAFGDSEGGGGARHAKMDMASVSKKRTGRGDGGDDGSTAAQITIKEWNPSTPYLQEIQAQEKSKAYDSYLGKKKTYGASPGFYLDCANFFFKQDRILALRILSNLAELKIEDAPLLRVLAWRMIEAEEINLAIEVFEKVIRLRPEEPQSHRDLALAYAKKMEVSHDTNDGVKAAELFYHVVLGSWDRFAEVETIVVMELNHLLMRMEKLDEKNKSHWKKKVEFIDSRLTKLLDLDVRITMSWDANNTDMDLHVIEPSGEEAFYGHNLTTIGGLVSRDFTQGYGPEEYVIHHAMPGVYKIKVKYYGSRQQNLMGPVTVSANVITNYGRSDEKHQLLTLRLTEAKDMMEIGSIAFGKVATEDSSKVSSLTLDEVKKLKKGMSTKSVIEALGEPERREGGALSVLLYRLVDGTQIRMGFGPELLWIRQVLDGAERNILQ
jgi:hypothetical protein